AALDVAESAVRDRCDGGAIVDLAVRGDAGGDGGRRGWQRWGRNGRFPDNRQSRHGAWFVEISAVAGPGEGDGWTSGEIKVEDLAGHIVCHPERRPIRVKDQSPGEELAVGIDGDVGSHLSPAAVVPANQSRAIPPVKVGHEDSPVGQEAEPEEGTRSRLSCSVSASGAEVRELPILADIEPFDAHPGGRVVERARSTQDDPVHTALIRRRAEAGRWATRGTQLHEPTAPGNRSIGRIGIRT